MEKNKIILPDEFIRQLYEAVLADAREYAKGDKVKEAEFICTFFNTLPTH